jgi:hypothetical protein
MLRARARVQDRRWGEVAPISLLLGVNIIGFIAFVNLEAIAGLPLFDRYALPVAPVVAFAVLRAEALQPVSAARATESQRIPVGVRVGAAAMVALLAFVGIALTAESASFDGARWRAAETAVAAGYDPLEVDGGFEWVAWHRREGPPYWPMVDAAEKKRLRREFEAPFCARVSIDPPENEPVIAVVRSSAPTRSDLELAITRIPGRCPTR